MCKIVEFIGVKKKTGRSLGSRFVILIMRDTF